MIVNKLQEFKMELIFGFFILISLFIVLTITFIPVIIAMQRKHNDTLLIFFLIFLFGWTIIGWVGALIWSLSSVSVLQNNKPQVSQSLTGKLNELSTLLNNKLITQEEHDLQKKKILESN